jgi:hypothetical protein
VLGDSDMESTRMELNERIFKCSNTVDTLLRGKKSTGQYFRSSFHRFDKQLYIFPPPLMSVAAG